METLAQFLARLSQEIIPDPSRIKQLIHKADRLLDESFRTSSITTSAFLRKRTDIIDTVLSRLCDSFLSGCPVALCALGGYGRRELFPKSDMDILFLLPPSKDKQAEKQIKKLLYVLWNCGLDIGHTSRTMDETLSLCTQDPKTATGIMESRLIWGNRGLFKLLHKQFSVLFEDQDLKTRYIQLKMREREERRMRYAQEQHTQEPNLKESAGGLRDIHTAYWISMMRGDIQSMNQVYTLTPDVQLARRALKGYRFICRLRIGLHSIHRLKHDTLSFSTQEELCRLFGIQPKNNFKPEEILMTQLCRSMRAIDRLYTQLYDLFDGTVKKISAAPRESHDIQYFLKTPYAILSAFNKLADAKNADSKGLLISLSASALKASSLRADPEAGRILLNLCTIPGKSGRILEAMHRTGVLCSLIPEFKRICCVVRRDLYHRYPLDEHAIRAVTFLDTIFTEKKKTVFRHAALEVDNTAVTYLSVLLHDLAKAHTKNHSLSGARTAGIILKRLGVPQEIIEAVTTIIRHHLLMAHISQRMDLEDDTTIRSFAATIKTPEILNNLLLMTYTDSVNTGPGIWSDWKESLLTSLYAKTRKMLVYSEKYPQKKDMKTLLQKISILLGDPEIFQRLKKNLPSKYFTSTPLKFIADHATAFKRHLKGTDPAIVWQHNKRYTYTAFTISTKDRIGLFASVAGAFTAHRVNILNALINTTTDGIVMDTFFVQDGLKGCLTDTEKQKAVTKTLIEILQGTTDPHTIIPREHRPSYRYKPSVDTTVHIDISNTVSANSTVIQVRCPDTIGLLYLISLALSDLGLTIQFAKASTEKHTVYDVFYVNSKDGGKIFDEETIKTIRHTLHERIDWQIQHNT